MLNFHKLRADNPGRSPAELFDIACGMENLPNTWANTPWTALSNWMDMFANAPASLSSH